MTGDHTDELPPSRTQRKRAAEDLQRIAQRLVDMDPGDRARIPLPVEVTDAIDLYQRISSREAQRRQLQFLGKLMRRIDTTPIEEALARLDGSSASARYAFHQLEHWRERLLAEPAALTEYLDAHPQADRQALRHALARIRKARDEQRLKSESRALFRLLRSFEESAD